MKRLAKLATVSLTAGMLLAACGDVEDTEDPGMMEEDDGMMDDDLGDDMMDDDLDDDDDGY